MIPKILNIFKNTPTVEEMEKELLEAVRKAWAGFKAIHRPLTSHETQGPQVVDKVIFLSFVAFMMPLLCRILNGTRGGVVTANFNLATGALMELEKELKLENVNV